MARHELYFQEAYLEMHVGTEGSSTLSRLREDVYRSAARYAELRVRWRLGDVPARNALDDERGRAHDAFITCCNALSREMRRQKLSNEWRKQIGDEATTEGRKRVGDFACFVSFALSMEAR